VSELNLALLLEASTAGGATCLTSVTELEPAAGPQASIAPAKFAQRGRDQGAFAYETRYLDDEPVPAVIVDSKQSQLNRAEQALSHAIEDGHPVLSRLPRITVTYVQEGLREVYSDLTLPHRAFDGHIRAGTVDGRPVTENSDYRAIRDANPGNARALLDSSPISLVFGSWDSSRAARQGRWRSVLVGEVIGFCAEERTDPQGRPQPTLKGGARVDPVGMSIKLDQPTLKALAQAQRSELSPKLVEKLTKGGRDVKSSALGLGGVPPTLEALAGVACHRIVRSHVLSFAALRQIRFGAGPDGDAACRALLAALTLNALARSDAELVLRANCDLREAGPTKVELDQRHGGRIELDPLSIKAADVLLEQALAHAESTADVRWDGVVLAVTGNPAIVAGAVEDEDGEAGA
jgi:CRISPR-associated protein Csb1